jgi:uncharacterized protein involved in response to NO
MPSDPPQTSQSPAPARGPAFFSLGFRPFFLGAGLLATLALPLWMLQFLGVIALPGVPDPLAWHIHEMLFGYLSAALAGFLLTAVPNWTNRPAVTGLPLAGLAALWLVGRAAMLTDADGAVGSSLAAAFLVVLAGFAWREVLAAGNRRNVPVCLLVSLLAAAEIVFLFADQDLGIRLGFATAAAMIMMIGGRIVPNFTANWLRARGATALPADFGTYDKATLAVGLAALLCWILLPGQSITAFVFIAAAAANFGRLARWRGTATLGEPLLVVLHLGYLWIPLAFTLFALAILAPGLVTPQQPLHALGAGAIGLMTLAVMTRASLGHSGRPLEADGATTLAYLLVFLGAASRILADWTGLGTPMLHFGAATWSGGFLVFVLRYALLLLRRRR